MAVKVLFAPLPSMAVPVMTGVPSIRSLRYPSSMLPAVSSLSRA